MTLINVLDILLVAFFFFILFQALYQTRALQVLRGALIIVILGVSIFFILPLQTFTYLVLGLLIVGAIAIPILFQDELKRALTGLGQIGLRRGHSSSYDQLKSDLISASEILVKKRFGALIVLEGQTPLDDIIETGIPTKAEKVTTELLTTIFFPNTPLHDGAVVLRGERLMAAACILPVQKEQTEFEHLGTRHRAALGLSIQAPDAMIIVISEETGNISVAQDGHLDRGLNLEGLEGRLENFQLKIESQPKIRWGWLRSGGLRVMFPNALISLVLAVIAWVGIMIQTNPIQDLSINEVPLIMVPPSSDLVLTSEVPSYVKVTVQTTDDLLDKADPSVVSAELDLSGLPSDAHQVPVEIAIAYPGIQFTSVDPSFVNVVLEEKISKELTTNVNTSGSISNGYRLEEIKTTPETVLIEGQESLVSQVVQAEVDISLNGRSENFQEILPVTLLDQDGEIVQGLTPSPSQVLVDVFIVQEFTTRVIAVYANVDMATLEPNYEVVSTLASPSVVTIKGRPLELANIGEYVETSPIDLTGITSELKIQAPLLVQDTIQVFNNENEEIWNVLVQVEVQPKPSFLSIEELVEIRGLNPELNASIQDRWVTVFMIGPSNLLDEIRSNPDLLILFVNLEGLTAGSYIVPIEFEAPNGLEIELFPSETEATIKENP